MTEARRAGVRRRPRQSDIARMAGVSQATVSLILRGTPAGMALARETRQRVLRAAEDLGYVPDPVATRLASASNAMLGLYTFSTTFPTDVAHSYYPILVGVEEEAAAQGQDLILFTGSARAAARADDPAAVRRVRAADGCLFFGRHVPDEPIRRLVEDGFPFVYIGRRDEPGIPYVGADYVSASAQVVARLAALGHREIRYLREHDQAPASADREEGVVRGARTSGIDPSRLVVRTDGSDLDDLLRRWLEEGVTAVVVEQTDTGAALDGLGAAVDRAGLRCPRDLSLALLGASTGTRGHAPGGGAAYGGFDVPMRAMGRDAVRLLLELIAGAHGEPPRRLLPCEPVEGGTVAAPRTRDT
ncbi:MULTISPECIES: LacI family DNA-binding transcriptional regulator [Nocardiopsis]|uniref:Transcriptional regulator n=1 Tax=Nocardiopsis sinuspersici TaxID=501010 RepID=A0A1V3C029_9ACTN|nr:MULTISPECIES: LacI family DNA-binding transcriptional regulator [Nocardiopsis]NYH55534.1 DNA-binding LacI/PurR family transcriptional regulator [Nocardiopsis sinuspersici]OOC54154.1 transcriptional regulator [Nocardiopsis sinuspersici]